MNIDTARVRLRPVASVDVDDLLALDSDPEVMRYVSGGAPTPRAVIEDWVVPRAQAERRLYGTGTWVICDPGGAFLGWISLRAPRHSSRTEVELSYRLRRDVWGRGLATEAATAAVAFAFENLETERVFASTVARNLSSRRVMEKIGMSLSAVHLCDDAIDSSEILTVHPDRDRSEVEYELLRTEWQRRTAQWSATEPWSSAGGLTA